LTGLTGLGCTTPETNIPADDNPEPPADEIPDQNNDTEVFEDITAQEAVTLIANNAGNADFVFLDVPIPEEFTQGHIMDGVNIDFYADNFREEID